MELSLTDLLLYQFPFHLKQQNALSRARPYSKWESVLIFHRSLTVVPSTHGYIYLSNYTTWFICIPYFYQKEIRQRFMSPKVFKGNLIYIRVTLFYHIIPVSFVLWRLHGFKTKGWPVWSQVTHLYKHPMALHHPSGCSAIR